MRFFTKKETENKNRIIIGKFKGHKIRVPEFKKNGKSNTNFKYYSQFVGKDESHDLIYTKGDKIGQKISTYFVTRLRIKECV